MSSHRKRPRRGAATPILRVLEQRPQVNADVPVVVDDVLGRYGSDLVANYCETMRQTGAKLIAQDLPVGPRTARSGRHGQRIPHA